MAVNTRHAGFSLLEVLVALVIASLVCALAFRAIGQASRHAASGQQFQHGLQLADTQLTLLAQQPEQWLGQHQGKLAGFHWASQVQQWHTTEAKPPTQPTRLFAPHPSAPDSGWQLYRIDLQLTLPGAQQPAIRLSTLKLGGQP